MAESRGRAIKEMYEGHMDNAKGGRFQGWRRGWVGQGDIVGENRDNYT